MYKAIVSDLDGTLLTSNKEIPDYSKNIIRNAVQEGIKFFIATGRHHLDTNYYKECIGENIYLITSNGARVHNPAGELIYSTNLDVKLIKDILDKEMTGESHINFYTDEGWILFETNTKLEEYIKGKEFKPRVIKRNEIDNLEIIKMFFFSDDPVELNKIEKNLKNEYGDKIEVYLTHDTCLEINSPYATKGNAMQKVLELEEIDLKETIAFGDHLNDYDMLVKAGKGLLMGQAYDKMKAMLPDYEVIGNCDDESVAKYIEKNVIRRS